MSGASLTLLASTGSAPVGASASPVSAVASLTSSTTASRTSVGDCCNLRLILTVESRKSFVKALAGSSNDLGGGATLTDSGHLDLFGRQKARISSFKHVSEGVLGEGHVAYVGADVDGQLHGPDCLGGSSTAASIQLGRFTANVVNDLISQLGR